MECCLDCTDFGCGGYYVEETMYEILGTIDLISDIFVLRSVFWAFQGFETEDGKRYEWISDTAPVPMWFKIGMVIFGFSVMVAFARNGICAWQYYFPGFIRKHHTTKEDSSSDERGICHRLKLYLFYWFFGIFVFAEIAIRVGLIVLDFLIVLILKCFKNDNEFANELRHHWFPFLPNHGFFLTKFQKRYFDDEDKTAVAFGSSSSSGPTMTTTPTTNNTSQASHATATAAGTAATTCSPTATGTSPSSSSNDNTIPFKRYQAIAASLLTGGRWQVTPLLIQAYLHQQQNNNNDTTYVSFCKLVIRFVLVEEILENIGGLLMSIGLTQMEGGQFTLLIIISLSSTGLSLILETIKYIRDERNAGTFDPREKSTGNKTTKQQQRRNNQEDVENHTTTSGNNNNNNNNSTRTTQQHGAEHTAIVAKTNTSNENNVEMEF